jgi:PPM family protein phosphatase
MTYHAEQVRFNLVRSHTDIGVVRANNEDAIAHNANLGIVVHAYSMGGHNAGEVASKLTVKNIRKVIEDYIAFLNSELSFDLARTTSSN